MAPPGQADSERWKLGGLERETQCDDGVSLPHSLAVRGAVRGVDEVLMFTRMGRERERERVREGEKERERERERDRERERGRE